MKKLFGNTLGLKPSQLKKLENLYRRRVPPEFLITPELTRDLARLSEDIRRQIGLLINRSGHVAYVLLGDRQGILIPDTSAAYRVAPGRLRGLRCIHTHLHKEQLTSDDLTDLALLRLDAMAVVEVAENGLPASIHWAHILPGGPDEQPYQVEATLSINQLNIDYLRMVQALETELARNRAMLTADQKEERALLVSVSTAPRRIAMNSLTELQELARSGNIDVAGVVLQQRTRIDPRFLMGKGKLHEIAIMALQKGADLLIFDQELNPSQIRSITDQIELKVIDRTQLILDIFAQRARTREGKLQVELAQLKYLLPRLVTKNTAMSRLTGGIGGRGPGETKLEINRRRVRDRIGLLEKSLASVQKHRRQQRSQRDKKKVPVISIIGYTNAGKSTLLNTLTHSQVLVENKLFATLDPSSRRLRFPRDLEVIITDTVGFIENLPQDLLVAFRATLEELESADILLHVIDLSNPRFAAQIESVEEILTQLNLHHIPSIRLLNKIDLVDPQAVENLSHSLNAVAVCAKDRSTLNRLIERLQETIAPLSVS
jgi:GTP-binding protein HflX